MDVDFAVCNHSKTYCPFCVNVKQLLTQLGANFKAIELDTESEIFIFSFVFESTGLYDFAWNWNSNFRLFCICVELRSNLNFI